MVQVLDAAVAGDDATMAVVAHALLNSLAVVEGSLTTITESHARMSAAQFENLLSMATVQTAHMAGVLRDLVLALPPEATETLDALIVAHPRSA